VSNLLRFAIIGDYGNGTSEEDSLAYAVKAYDPEYVFTVGDNYDGSGTYNTTVGPFGKWVYHNLTDTRFYPIPGQQDYLYGGLDPYLNAFALPYNGGCCRYYWVTIGPVQFFCCNSNVEEPDGVDAASIQAEWLRVNAEASTVPFRICLMAHSPFSSSLAQEGDLGNRRGNVFALRWGSGPGEPYERMTFHVSGHNHHYERMAVSGLTYLVGGHGERAANLMAFSATPIPESLVRIASTRGFLVGEANWGMLSLKCMNLDGEVLDEVTRYFDG
jgi:hypothetical protein